jgi:hypothetical protein
VFELTDGLVAGENEIEVRVANTLGNIILETYAGASGLKAARSGVKAPPELLISAE